MKFLSGCLLILCVLIAPAAFGEEKSIVFASTEYPPFYGEKLPDQGILTDITVRAFKKMGYRVKVEFMPFMRTLSYGRAGTVDGVIALWRSKEREEWFAFSAPLASNQIGFYKRRDARITYASLEDLRQYRIGTVAGYANPPEFETAHLRVDEVSSDDVNLRKLAAGRIDLALIDRYVARYLLDTKMPELADKLEWMDPPLETRPQYVGFSKKAANYEIKLRDFDLGLKKLAADGELQEILKKGGFRNQ